MVTGVSLAVANRNTARDAGFLREVIQREYTLGGPIDARYGYSRVSFDAIPVGPGLLRLQTGNRDSHFQVLVKVWVSESGFRFIEGSSSIEDRRER